MNAKEGPKDGPGGRRLGGVGGREAKGDGAGVDEALDVANLEL